MSKNFNRKKLVIATISTICIALFVILIVAFWGNKSGTEITKNQNSNNEVTVGEIQTEVKAESIAVNPSDSKIESSVTVLGISNEGTEDKESCSKDIELTKVIEKPQAPEKPATAVDSEESHDKPTDPALTDPTKKPSTKVKPVEPTKPTEEKPASGSTNSKGETYVPGFGWVKDSGSNVGGTSNSNGDWNKQIGDMN